MKRGAVKPPTCNKYFKKWSRLSNAIIQRFENEGEPTML